MKLPTLEQCDKICDKNDAFYKSIDNIENTEIITFNYRLASHSDFIEPFIGSDIGGFELRGLCFVNRGNGRYIRYPMLTKFHNINEGELNQSDILLQKTVRHIQTKEDGSMIRFIRLNNGKVVAKTKGSFVSEQAIKATMLYNQYDYVKDFVDVTLQNGETAIFEYVGADNRIVLEYTESKLVLLQVRNDLSGSYYDIESMDYPYKAEYDETKTLSDIIALAETEKNIEGWVVQFNDGSLVKVKTQDYFIKHRLVSNLNSLSNMIHLALDNELDDIKSLSVTYNMPNVYTAIVDVDYTVSNYVNRTTTYIYDIVSTEFNRDDRKTFALKYKCDKAFSMMMTLTKNITQENAYEVVKTYIKKQTNKESIARTWLKDNK